MIHTAPMGVGLAGCSSDDDSSTGSSGGGNGEGGGGGTAAELAKAAAAETTQATRAQTKTKQMQIWSFHQLRHSFCSTLVRNGVSVEAVRVLAGHADLKTTQRYVHASAADLKAAVLPLAR